MGGWKKSGFEKSGFHYNSTFVSYFIRAIFKNNSREMVVYKSFVQTVSLLQQAVNFLNSMNWNTEGNACFACMSIIMNNLLKLPLNSEREGKEVSTSLE